MHQADWSVVTMKTKPHICSYSFTQLKKNIYFDQDFVQLLSLQLNPRSLLELALSTFGTGATEN